MRPEVKRTCSKCGYTWKMPRYYTKHHRTEGFAPSSGGPAGFEQMGPAPIVGERSDYDMREQQNEQWLEAKAQDAVCAKCGSNKYRQRRVWSESSAEYEGTD
jgi:predicted nucleic-acid-binding Zn-ribbon protein